MSRVYEQRLQQHRQLAAKLGELDVFLTGLRHMVHDAPFTTDADRLEAIRGMFSGAVKVRAVPTPQPGELKLEFFRLEQPEHVSVTEGVTAGVQESPPLTDELKRAQIERYGQIPAPEDT